MDHEMDAIDCIADDEIDSNIEPDEIERERLEAARVAAEARLAAEAARREEERAYTAAWHAAGRAKIVCSICRKGPFGGFALYRRDAKGAPVAYPGGELFCEEHVPKATRKP